MLQADLHAQLLRLRAARTSAVAMTRELDTLDIEARCYPLVTAHFGRIHAQVGEL